MKEKETHRRDTHRLMSAAIAGLAASLYSDLADNPPADFTEKDIARHREAAKRARKNHQELMELSRKGGAE